MKSAGKIDILLVEDAPADIYLIECAIADCSPHVQVWQVSRGDYALTFLRHELPFVKAPAPALILLDLHIPGRDGYAVLTELRSSALYRTTPVIVISGSERAVEEPRCLELGAHAYVQKSPDFDTYFGRIQTMMQEWLVTEGAPPASSLPTPGSGTQERGTVIPQEQQRIAPFFLTPAKK